MKTFATLSVVLFSVLALLQLCRFLMGWPISINGLAVPLWPSAVAALVLVSLAIGVWRESRRRMG